MANTTVSTVTITKDNALHLVDSIRENLKVVSKGYLTIAPDIQKLYDTKAHEVLGYKNFDELVDNMFDMSHGTSVGIRKVFGLYGTKSSKTGEYMIPEKYTKFGYTKLLYFATEDKKFKTANINPIELFSPEMSLAQMKDTLTNALIAKAKEQDENAIETTAEDVTANAENGAENVAENGAENVAENGAENEPKSMAEKTANPRAFCDDIIKDMNALKSAIENDIKPEKMALLDGAIAYMKDIKKLLKK